MPEKTVGMFVWTDGQNLQTHKKYAPRMIYAKVVDHAQKCIGLICIACI